MCSSAAVIPGLFATLEQVCSPLSRQGAAVTCRLIGVRDRVWPNQRAVTGSILN